MIIEIKGEFYKDIKDLRDILKGNEKFGLVEGGVESVEDFVYFLLEMEMDELFNEYGNCGYVKVKRKRKGKNEDKK